MPRMRVASCLVVATVLVGVPCSCAGAPARAPAKEQRAIEAPLKPSSGPRVEESAPPAAAVGYLMPPDCRLIYDFEASERAVTGLQGEVAEEMDVGGRFVLAPNPASQNGAHCRVKWTRTDVLSTDGVVR